MFKPMPRQGYSDLFESAKTAAPVPARHPALRTCLVQISLDPQVRAIGHVATAYVEAVPVAVDLDAIVLTRDDGSRIHLDVVPARQVRDPEEEELVRLALLELGIESLTVTAEDIEAEPRRSNADLVWSYAGRRVPLDLRMCVLQLLVDEGPLRLGRLLKAVNSDREPTAAVMSMCCSDLLEIDLTSGPLGPLSAVRIRS
jgi:hypothetical protein